MSKSWTASLQLPVCLLGLVLPRDFSRCAERYCAPAVPNAFFTATLAVNMQLHMQPDAGIAGAVRCLPLCLSHVPRTQRWHALT
jgi:hypothetical protein